MSTIFPSITTHGYTASTWRHKLIEIEKLQLERFGLFVTGLHPEQRSELFGELTNLRRRHDFCIPFVHAVSSMSEPEYHFLVEGFGTEAFNLHPLREFPLQHPLSNDLRSKIFIENSTPEVVLTPKDIEGFAGICLDLSHLEETRRNDQQKFELIQRTIERFPIGANHLSAVKVTGAPVRGTWNPYSHHVAEHADELNYIATYDPRYLSSLCALELENSIAEQLALIDHINLSLHNTRRHTR